jgi:hypothetical protein
MLRLNCRATLLLTLGLSLPGTIVVISQAYGVGYGVIAEFVHVSLFISIWAIVAGKQYSADKEVSNETRNDSC